MAFLKLATSVGPEMHRNSSLQAAVLNQWPKRVWGQVPHPLASLVGCVFHTVSQFLHEINLQSPLVVATEPS